MTVRAPGCDRRFLPAGKPQLRDLPIQPHVPVGILVTEGDAEGSEYMSRYDFKVGYTKDAAIRNPTVRTDTTDAPGTDILDASEPVSDVPGSKSPATSRCACFTARLCVAPRGRWQACSPLETLQRTLRNQAGASANMERGRRSFHREGLVAAFVSNCLPGRTAFLEVRPTARTRTSQHH